MLLGTLESKEIHLNEEELRKSSPKTRGNVQLGPGQVRTDQYRGESWV